jgi:hypothetical protein
MKIILNLTTSNGIINFVTSGICYVLHKFNIHLIQSLPVDHKVYIVHVYNSEYVGTFTIL